MNDLLASVMTDITPIINTLIFTILSGIATWLGIKMKGVMESWEKSQKLKEIKEGLEINKEIIKTSVDYAEKIGAHLAGTEKFKLAKDKAYEIMGEWGIQISDAEVKALIEQMVLGYEGKEKVEEIELKIEEVEEKKGEI